MDIEVCTECGTCAEKCHIDAITMCETGSGAEAPEVNMQICLGCGVCAAACPSGALTMSRRSILSVPPVDKTDKLTRIAREKEKKHFRLGPV